MPQNQSSPSTAVSVAHQRIPLGFVIAIACVAQFMIILQESVVNVALPDMRDALGLSTGGQQWVVDGYLITFGGLLLLAARASDLFGRKRVFLTGLGVFTLAGLGGGIARSGGWLIAACFVQGMGAAALAPASLSLITASHPEGPARTRALTMWSAVAGAAAPLGLVLGGVLTELSWRYVMFANVPIGIAMIIAATIGLSPGRPNSHRGRLDLPGSLTVTVGVGALVFGISEATTKEWGATIVLAALATAIGLLVAFFIIESRSPAPLLPLGILRSRGLSVANGVIACVGVTLTAQLFFVSLYLQEILSYSALRTGLAMIPMSVAMIGASVSAKSLIPRFGARPLLVAGASFATLGLLWLSRLTVDAAYLAHVAGPTLVLGAGIGLMVLPVTEAATAGIAARDAGLGSGLFNVSRQIGGAVGLAVLVTIASTTTRDSRLGDPAAATVHGYRAALLVCAGLSLASIAISLLLPRPAAIGDTAQPAGTVA